MKQGFEGVLLRKKVAAEIMNIFLKPTYNDLIWKSPNIGRRLIILLYHYNSISSCIHHFKFSMGM